MTGQVWFTSDTHFRHAKVAEDRGFATITDHDDRVIERWNSVVRPGDQVWHLGDFGLGPPDRYLGKTQRLHGTIHLVAGNHDPVWPGHRDSYRYQPVWMQFFASIQPWARRRIAGRDVLLCHLPYQGDHTPEDRYPEYRLPDRGMPMLCGHVHGAWKHRYTEPNQTFQLNVGMDVWGLLPISLELVTGLVETAG